MAGLHGSTRFRFKGFPNTRSPSKLDNWLSLLISRFQFFCPHRPQTTTPSNRRSVPPKKDRPIAHPLLVNPGMARLPRCESGRSSQRRWIGRDRRPSKEPDFMSGRVVGWGVFMSPDDPGVQDITIFTSTTWENT